MIRFALIAAVLLLAAGCHKSDATSDSAGALPAAEKPQTVTEHEPDDAQHAQPIALRSIVLGEITPGKKGAADDDWYRVVPGIGTSLALRIELAAMTPIEQAAPRPEMGPLDAQLEVTDRDRNRLLLGHASSGEPLLLPAVLCAETCFVHVWGTAAAAYKLTVLGAAPLETQELEPNNRAIDATPLAAGKSIQGTLFSPDDEDWFRVTAQAKPNQFLRVELAGVPGVRPELELRALSDGALLATFRAAAGGEGIFLRDLSLAGDIAPPDPPMLHRTVVDAGPLDAGASQDAGTAAEADAGSADADADASSPAPAQEGQAIDAGADAGDLPDAAVAVEPGVDAGAVAPAPVLDASVVAVAPAALDAGAAVAQAPIDAGAATSPGDAGIANAAPTTTDAGTVSQQGYYFVIKSSPLTDEKKAPRGANQLAPYTLATALESGSVDLEAEPNDDPQHATWVEKVRTGFLAPAGDSDWYRVRNEGKSVLRAEVSALARADVELSVFSAPAHPGEKPLLLAHANEGGVREGEILPAVGIDGDALVLVQCAPRELDGVKVRDCEDRDAPYKLSVALAADEGAVDREPNDDPDHAQAVTIPAKIVGTLWPKRDVDQFGFQLDAPRSVSFRLSTLRGVDTMLTLRQLRTNKRGKVSAEVIGTADASRGGGPEEIIAVPLKPGAYSIEVSSPKREGSPTQTYTLQIQ